MVDSGCQWDTEGQGRSKEFEEDETRKWEDGIVEKKKYKKLDADMEGWDLRSNVLRSLHRRSSKLLAIWVGRFMQRPALGNTFTEILLVLIKMDEAVRER